jgi:PLP dependent protein
MVAVETGLAGRLESVRAAIRRSEADHRREAGAATLIAVSKTFSADVISEAIAAGQRVFGENYVQESLGKWPALKATTPDVELHFIGPLQSNKAAEAVSLFDAIHSLDRESLARELRRQIDRVGRAPRLLVQVNTGDESQKAGVSAAGLGAFLASCREKHGLTIDGLMAIPPFDQPPSPHFALLAKLARQEGLPLLSIGMSADFDAAIQQGATHVRVGSAIFGARAPRPVSGAAAA